MKGPDSKEPSGCNCKVSEECPLNGACLVRDVVYDAKAISGGETM